MAAAEVAGTMGGAGSEASSEEDDRIAVAH
jgi:hypothetical protein